MAVGGRKVVKWVAVYGDASVGFDNSSVIVDVKIGIVGVFMFASDEEFCACGEDSVGCCDVAGEDG